jgi:hypothetical protein
MIICDESHDRFQNGKYLSNFYDREGLIDVLLIPYTSNVRTTKVENKCPNNQGRVNK